MSRFRIEHPHDPERHAYAGHDHAVGFFCEVYRGERREKPVKTLDVFTTERPVTLISALDFLANQGFFSHEDLEDALLWMRDEEPEHGSAAALKIVSIIESFKAE